jgi:hypothetical protein
MNSLECKYTKWYFNIINNCKLNPPKECYTETHHIKPRSIGGCDSKDNLVKLTAKQHFICHLLLTKMFAHNTQEYFKMIHAFCMMSWNTGNAKMYRYTSKIYTNQRQIFSAYLSDKYIGLNNSQYGTIWIYNDETKECKKVNTDYILPVGWKRGRILNWEKHFEQLTKRKNTIIHCKECGNKLTKLTAKQTFCNTGCGNAYRFKNAKTITMHKNGEVKEIKAQNVPAYRKLGWYC